MKFVDDITKELKERWPDNATAKLSLEIVEALADLPQDQLKMLTFTSIKNAIHRDKIDDELILAVALLANTTVHALDSRLLFIDDDENEFEVENDELATAIEVGEFIHPETGVPVKEFEEKIIPFFVPLISSRKVQAG